MPITTKRLAVFVTTLAAAALVGCSSPGDAYEFDAIASDLTPNMRGIAERNSDVDGNLAINKNMNVRNMWDDLGRFFYTDHPSRLSPYPVAYTSGQPR